MTGRPGGTLRDNMTTIQQLRERYLKGRGDVTASCTDKIKDQKGSTVTIYTKIL